MMSDGPGTAGRIKVTLLGTGTSVGIPIIGCTCTTCRSNDPRDYRTRCSCLVQTGGTAILIDTSPDLRRQVLDHRIRHIDAVLFTHHHFDHIAGIDDLRPFLFRTRGSIPCYANAETADSLEAKYDYIFGHDPHPSAPGLVLKRVDGSFTVTSRLRPDRQVVIHPVPVVHGNLNILGFRVGAFGYITDASRLAEASIDRLSGVHTLVLNALRRRPHPTHFSIEEAIEVSRRIGAEKTYFVHMTHDVLHARDNMLLPPGFEFGYDGLRFELAAS